MTSRETGFTTKDEGSTGRIPKGHSSSRPWSTLKDPRIVRVSRSFGGKDRHSKVCTVKGLRDRRVRLSVQTAIQLYDLQDRLGLSQPSKVVDWLLNVAQHDIDKLPPLQMPIENFVHYAQSMVVSNAITPSQAPSCSNFVGNAGHVKTISTGPQSLAHKANYMRSTDNNVVGEDQASLVNPARWNFDASLRAKCKEVGRETMSEKNTWIKRNDEESHQGPEYQGAQVTLLNNVMPYASYYHWESPSNPCHVSHLGGIGYSSQAEEPHKFHTSALPSSSLSLPSGSPMLFCPSGVMPPIFPPCLSASTDYDLKHINHFQMLNSNPQNLMPNSFPTPLYPFSTPTVRPLQLNITTRHHQSENDQGSQSENSQQG